jgi:hypothetical protein
MLVFLADKAGEPETIFQNHCLSDFDSRPVKVQKPKM